MNPHHWLNGDTLSLKQELCLLCAHWCAEGTMRYLALKKREWGKLIDSMVCQMRKLTRRIRIIQEAEAQLQERSL